MGVAVIVVVAGGTGEVMAEGVVVAAVTSGEGATVKVEVVVAMAAAVAVAVAVAVVVAASFAMAVIVTVAVASVVATGTGIEVNDLISLSVWVVLVVAGREGSKGFSQSGNTS